MKGVPFANNLMIIWKGFGIPWETRSSRPELSVKKVFLEILQNSQENTCAKVSFLIKLQAWGNFIKKETLAQLFSSEFGEISKNPFS